MDAGPRLSLEKQFAAASDWWRDAGVDCAFAEEPTNWLAPDDDAGNEAPQEITRAHEPAQTASIDTATVDLVALPVDLTGFTRWWLSEPSLDEGGSSPRIAPRGVAGAELMIVVPMPEEVDRQSLLSGQQGRMIGSMLSALGVDPANAYLASALPRHMILPDWTAVLRSGLGGALLHHIALVQPRRLLVMGRDIGPLLGGAKPEGSGWLGTVGGDNPVATLVSYGPETLLRQPRFRKALWHQLLELTEKTA